MAKSRLSRLPALLVCVALFGCASISSNLNEGANRVSYAGGPAVGPAEPAPVADGRAFFLDDDFTVGAPIEKNDIYQIKLISAFICNFRELDGTVNAVADSNRGAEPCRSEQLAGSGPEGAGEATRGEIAITAGLQFRGANAKNEGERVVFFSDDVRETGQMLNFLHVPLYGPAAYSPQDATLSIKIIEIDEAEATRQRAFLDTISAAGQMISSPVYGTAFNTLIDIGKGFVAANANDIEMAFQVGFDVPGAPDSRLRRLRLREGYLVIMRREVRSESDHFPVKVCAEHGFIVRETAACSDMQHYNDHTWLLLRISKEHPDTVRAALAGVLLDTITAADQANESALGQTIAGLVGRLSASQ